MSAATEAKELIDDLFEEEALVIGGLVAIHDVEDDLVWRLFRNLNVIRKKTLRHLDTKAPLSDGDPPGDRAGLKPHPAIEEFLLRLRKP